MRSLKKFYKWLMQMPEPDTRLPHQKYPDLIYWKTGDEIDSFYIRGCGWRRHDATYRGILDNNICLQLTDGSLFKIPVDEFPDITNRHAIRRKGQRDVELASIEMEKQGYNELLKEIQKSNQLLLEKWRGENK